MAKQAPPDGRCARHADNAAPRSRVVRPPAWKPPAGACRGRLCALDVTARRTGREGIETPRPGAQR
jgi:hypothetical protein